MPALFAMVHSLVNPELCGQNVGCIVAGALDYGCSGQKSVSHAMQAYLIKGRAFSGFRPATGLPAV